MQANESHHHFTQQQALIERNCHASGSGDAPRSLRLLSPREFKQIVISFAESLDRPHGLLLVDDQVRLGSDAAELDELERLAECAEHGDAETCGPGDDADAGEGADVAGQHPDTLAFLDDNRCDPRGPEIEGSLRGVPHDVYLSLRFVGDSVEASYLAMHPGSISAFRPDTVLIALVPHARVDAVSKLLLEPNVVSRLSQLALMNPSKRERSIEMAMLCKDIVQLRLAYADRSRIVHDLPNETLAHLAEVWDETLTIEQAAYVAAHHTADAGFPLAGCPVSALRRALRRFTTRQELVMSLHQHAVTELLALAVEHDGMEAQTAEDTMVEFLAFKETIRVSSEGAANLLLAQLRDRGTDSDTDRGTDGDKG